MTGEEGGEGGEGGEENCHPLITSLLNEGAVIKITDFNGHLRFCLQPKGSARTPLGPKVSFTKFAKVSMQDWYMASLHHGNEVYI